MDMDIFYRELISSIFQRASVVCEDDSDMQLYILNMMENLVQLSPDIPSVVEAFSEVTEQIQLNVSMNKIFDELGW